MSLLHSIAKNARHTRTLHTHSHTYTDKKTNNSLVTMKLTCSFISCIPRKSLRLYTPRAASTPAGATAAGICLEARVDSPSNSRLTPAPVPLPGLPPPETSLDLDVLGAATALLGSSACQVTCFMLWFGSCCVRVLFQLIKWGRTREPALLSDSCGNQTIAFLSFFLRSPAFRCLFLPNALEI